MENPGVALRELVGENRGFLPPRCGFDSGVMTGPPLGRGKLSGYEHSRRSQPGRGLAMAHEIAKLLLEKAGTFLERTEAIKVALKMGMPLNEIQEYLDWLDSIRPQLPGPTNSADADADDERLE